MYTCKLMKLKNVSARSTGYWDQYPRIHPVIQPHSSTVAIETTFPSSPVKADVAEEVGAHVDRWDGMRNQHD